MSAVKTSILRVQTRGKGLYEITAKLEKALAESAMTQGVLTVFCRHTSASLIITENADPTATADVCAFLEKLVPYGNHYTHTLEGMDDATSHIKSVLTRTGESIPFESGKLLLGTWQGVFVWEHRAATHTRQVTLSFVGE